MGRLSLLVIGNGRRYQNKYQDRRNRFQGCDEHGADETCGLGRRGRNERKHDAGDQSDENLHHQTGAHQPVQKGVCSLGHGKINL